MKFRSILATLIAAWSLPAAAATIVIDSADNGWYTNTGSHSASNTNTWTGTDGYGTYRNSFYNFDVSGVTGNVTAASITFLAGNGQYNSIDAYETVQVWDVNTVPGLGSSLAVYNDLGSGVLYGQTDYYASNYESMREFTVSLSSASFADIMADGFFSVGTSLASLASNYRQVLWSSSSYLPAARLTLETGPAAVPAPAALSLLLLGLAGTCLRRAK
ncbi:MAG: hypothetical protein KDI19_03990 [Pseudomonadales bacterium]|nr:hypothetical protein [Pseudomonadales bacterium]